MDPISHSFFITQSGNDFFITQSGNDKGNYYIAGVYGEVANYLGVRVELYNPKKYSQISNVAFFKIKQKEYVSFPEWYGPPFGITAKILEEMPKEKKTPQALGFDLVQRMEVAAKEFLNADKFLKNSMFNSACWQMQLAKTLCYLRVHQQELRSISAGETKIVKKQGVKQNISVIPCDFDSPGFSLIKTDSGRLIVKLNSIWKKTPRKILKHVWEFGTKNLHFYIKPEKEIKSRRWAQEVNIAKQLMEAQKAKVDLTGLLVPLEVVAKRKKIEVVEDADNQILVTEVEVLQERLIVKRGVKDLLEELKYYELGLETALEFSWQISKGLSTLHSLGIAYRDMKPENVIIFKEEYILSCNITDFEGASINEDFKNGFDSFGSPDYQGPEYLTKDIVDVDMRKIDSWALGMVLFTIFTSKAPSFFKKRNNFNREVLDFLPMMMTHPKIPEPIRYIIFDLLNIDWKKRIFVSEAHARINAYIEEQNQLSEMMNNIKLE